MADHVWRRWSIRARITAAATAALLPVLVVAVATGIWVQRADLTAGITSLAEDQARTLATDVPDGSSGPAVDEESLVQIVSLTTGRVLTGSGNAGSVPLAPAPHGATPEHHHVSGPVPTEPDPYAVVALRSADGTSYVVVGRSLESVDAATASTSVLLAVGGLLVLLATGALTWRATGGALAPVEDMRRRAASISANDLGRRLPVPAATDELANLATTLNDLLGRIDESTRKERQFVADASHELRSPLATIRALVESDRLSPHPRGHAGLTDEVLLETGRLTTLVDDLLVLARGDARRPTVHRTVDLSTIVRAEVHRARSIRVASSIADGLVVEGDAETLGVAIRNVIDNAERFAGTTVEVTASRVGDDVVVAVVDDGPGVPVDDSERIFERFVRLDHSRSRSDGGAGLGLAITRQVVSSHRGTVTVSRATSSATSTGARFTITVPSIAR